MNNIWKPYKQQDLVYLSIANYEQPKNYHGIVSMNSIFIETLLLVKRYKCLLNIFFFNIWCS